MKNNTKKPAFSLMEVMVILLIMAVTLAATAPMISKKMSRNVGTAEEPWKFSGSNQSISFKTTRNNATILVGADRIGRPLQVGGRPLPSTAQHSGLYIAQRMANVNKIVGDSTFDRNPHLANASKHALINFTAPVGITLAADTDVEDNNILGYLGVRNSLNPLGGVPRIGQLIFGSNASPGYNKTYFGTSLRNFDNVDDMIADDLANQGTVQMNTGAGGALETLRVFGEDAGRSLDDRVVITADGYQGNGPIRNATIVGSGYNSASMDRVLSLGHNLQFAHGPHSSNQASGVSLNTDFNATLDTVLIGMNLRPEINSAGRTDSSSNIFHAAANEAAAARRYTAQNITAIGNRLFVYGEGVTAIGDRVVGGRLGCNLPNTGTVYQRSRNATAIGTLSVPGGESSVAIGDRSMAGRPATYNGNVPQNERPFAVAIGNRARATGNRAIHIGGTNDSPDDVVDANGNVNIRNLIRADGVIYSANYIAGVNDNIRDPNLGAHAARAIQIGDSDTSHRVMSNNAILIGHGNIQASRANSVAIGTDAIPTAANQIMLGSDGQNGRVTAPTVVILGTLDVQGSISDDTITAIQDKLGISDIRLKNVGEKFTSGLEDIKKLEFFNYTYKNDKEKKPHVGVMAQDLQKIFPISVSEGSDGYLRIRTDEMFYAALNAIKELNQKIVALAGEVKEFFSRVDKLDIRVAKHQTTLDQLKSESAEIDARLARLEEE